MDGYWILQICAGQPILRGPFASHEEREHEFDMCLIDPGNEYLVHIDPTPAPAHAWLPSKEYTRERKLYIDSLPD